MHRDGNMRHGAWGMGTRMSMGMSMMGIGMGTGMGMRMRLNTDMGMGMGMGIWCCWSGRVCTPCPLSCQRGPFDFAAAVRPRNQPHQHYSLKRNPVGCHWWQTADGERKGEGRR